MLWLHFQKTWNIQKINAVNFSPKNMKLTQFKSILTTIETVNFKLSDGTFVPKHFHITEVGLITKKFIDCGGTVRQETLVNFQIWNAIDLNHRLKSDKMLQIIALYEKTIGIEDFEIEVEYQKETIGKYSLDFDGLAFVLINKTTNCLAQDQCGIPKEKPNKNLKELNSKESCCAPNGNCC